MWSHVSHHPPISKNIGLTGFGQCRSSRIQNSSSSPSLHSTGKSSPSNRLPKTSAPVSLMPPPYPLSTYLHPQPSDQHASKLRATPYLHGSPHAPSPM